MRMPKTHPIEFTETDCNLPPSTFADLDKCDENSELIRSQSSTPNITTTLPPAAVVTPVIDTDDTVSRPSLSPAPIIDNAVLYRL